MSDLFQEYDEFQPISPEQSAYTITALHSGPNFMRHKHFPLHHTSGIVTEETIIFRLLKAYNVTENEC